MPNGMFVVVRGIKAPTRLRKIDYGSITKWQTIMIQYGLGLLS